MNDTYQIHIKCTNCGRKSNTPEEMLEIPVGTPIYIRLLNQKCKNCGCKTLTENR